MRTEEIERLSSFPQDFFAGATEKKGWISDTDYLLQVYNFEEEKAP
jgi:hypothetical protein